MKNKQVNNRTPQQIIHSLINRNYNYYGVDIDYDRNSSNCSCGDYCRCSVITNAKINDIDERYIKSGIIKDICKEFKKETQNEIFLYCVERVLACGKFGEKDYYDINVSNGYYGEEIRSIDFQNADAVSNNLISLFKIKKPIDWVKFVLEIEYGFLLDDIKNSKKVILIEAMKDNLIVPNETYATKLNKEKIQEYDDHHRNYPIGIYRAVGFEGMDKNRTIVPHKYNIMDGYHRHRAFKNSTDKTCKIIVVE